MWLVESDRTAHAVERGGSANTLGLPLVIEIVDEEEAIERFLPTIDRLVGEGLVALEAVRVVKYPATAGG
jgi:PII-like signaling protein